MELALQLSKLFLASLDLRDPFHQPAGSLLDTVYRLHATSEAAPPLPQLRVQLRGGGFAPQFQVVGGRS